MHDRRQPDPAADVRLAEIIESAIERKIQTLQPREPRNTGVERHAQTVLISVITAAILFTATFMYNSNEKVTALATEFKNVAVQLEKLEVRITALSSNYTAKRDFDRLEERVRQLETAQARHK